MKNMKGFTLVELIIVIVIVGILSIVAVPVYKGYTKKAMGTEAKSLIGSIATAERVYFAEYSNYWATSTSGTAQAGSGQLTGYDKVLDVDARNNKYFTGYTVSTNQGDDDSAIFTATVVGNGDTGARHVSVTLVNQAGHQPVLTENYGSDVQN